MSMRSILTHPAFGYSIASLSAATALIMFTGVLLPPGVPMEMRVMFGIVLALLAVYRSVVTRIRQQQERSQDHGKQES
ncbi:MAG: hypothetical protein QHI48_08455 [Bacteroidota bacterium]|nr:hypothetical protein [Bacteroidota bacterium]